MKLKLRQKILSLRTLQGILLLEVLIIGWGLHALFTLKTERQQDVNTHMYASKQWQKLEAALSHLSDMPMVNVLREKGRITGMHMQDTKSLVEWRQLLISLQHDYWLHPVHMLWQRRGTQWQGDLTWHFTKPATLKPEQNWLPVPEQSSWPSAGELLTTVRHKQAAALLNVDGEEGWYLQGHWLPSLHATLTHIDQDSITFANVQGEQRQLHLDSRWLEPSQQEGH